MILINERRKMTTAKEQIKSLLDDKEKEHLLERLDEVEIELSRLTHKQYQLEDRKKYLLKKINELDGYKEDTVHKQLFGV